ncbi:Toxin RTX-I translocation ATP-binding protein [compost metagenome]
MVKDKTVIVVAHKLATIRNSNQIIVLNDGRIEEQGDHPALMQKQGLYHRLHQIQQQSGGWRIERKTSYFQADSAL